MKEDENMINNFKRTIWFKRFLPWIFLLLMLPVKAKTEETHYAIKDLFDGLDTSPYTIQDSLMIDKADTQKKVAIGKLAPAVDLFTSFNSTTEPTGMVPVPPDNLLAMVQNPSNAQPFSKNIFRMGGSFSVPLFIMPVYSTIKKAKLMAQTATLKKEINDQKNRALVVGLNANLQYMAAMDAALEQKYSSLLKTKEIIEIKVNENRVSKSALLKIEAGLNDIKLLKSNIELNRSVAKAEILKLTGINIVNPVDMTQTGSLKKDSFAPLKPLQNKIATEQKNVRIEKDKLYPKLVLLVNYNHSMAKSYNNDIGVQENFASIGVVLNMPLFRLDQYYKIKLAKIDYKISQNDMAKLKVDLKSQAAKLNVDLETISKQIVLYQSSLEQKEELLGIAKASYDVNRMTIEDYLKYEDDVLMETAKLFKTKAKKWQTLMQLAVIYGNNIEDIVK